MEQQIDDRLEALRSLTDSDFLEISGIRYLSAATTARIVGRTPQTISAWCRNGKVFHSVKRMAQRYKPDYLIPLSEVERAITEDLFPRPGNPAFRAGRSYPYNIAKRERGKRVKREKAETV